MTAHDLVFEYVLGALSPDETAAFEAELDKSPELLAEVAAATDALCQMPAALTPRAPAPSVRERLMATVAGSDRFSPFAADIAKYTDLAVAKVRELFQLIDGEWEDSPFPGIKLIHFDHGPNAFAPDTGFVTLPAGLEFPKHSHHGFEVNYVLEGRLVDDDGTVYGPGDALEKTVEDVHSFSVPEDRDTVIFVAQSGFDIIVPE